MNIKVKQVERMVRACMNHLKKKEYELGITKADVDTAVRVLEVIDKKGVTGCGGRDIIKINMSYWQHSNEPHTVTEYKSFNEDPVIGKHEVQNFEHCVWLEVAHEVSHHVQYAICPHIKRFSRRGSKSYFKPHGDGFKAIYRYLRKDFINPLIDANESYFDHWFTREDLPKPKVKKVDEAKKAINVVAKNYKKLKSRKDNLLKKQKQYESNLKRVQNSLKKVERSIAQYEKKYDEERLNRKYDEYKPRPQRVKIDWEARCYALAEQYDFIKVEEDDAVYESRKERHIWFHGNRPDNWDYDRSGDFPVLPRYSWKQIYELAVEQLKEMEDKET
jgi:hypothetical protein